MRVASQHGYISFGLRILSCCVNLLSYAVSKSKLACLNIPVFSNVAASLIPSVVCLETRYTSSHPIPMWQPENCWKISLTFLFHGRVRYCCGIIFTLHWSILYLSCFILSCSWKHQPSFIFLLFSHCLSIWVSSMSWSQPSITSAPALTGFVVSVITSLLFSHLPELRKFCHMTKTLVLSEGLS